MIAATRSHLVRLDARFVPRQPVAVLGLARSGVALARFLCGPRRPGHRLRRPPGRGASDAIARLEGRPVALRLGPPSIRGGLADQALVRTSPSVNSRFPTTEPRLRAALAAVESVGRVPVVSEVDLFLRLCPATHHRRHRDQGQDHDELAHRRGAGAG